MTRRSIGYSSFFARKAAKNFVVLLMYGKEAQRTKLIQIAAPYYSEQKNVVKTLQKQEKGTADGSLRCLAF